ncbi:MAG: hypothetical protein LBP86_07790 [Azoarcus sp.]|nr:hypothetical protein [Azoarcus sp.]
MNIFIGAYSNPGYSFPGKAMKENSFERRRSMGHIPSSVSIGNGLWLKTFPFATFPFGARVEHGGGLIFFVRSSVRFRLVTGVDFGTHRQTDERWRKS